MKCLILASGFGTRLYPVTSSTAKGLLPYKGKPVVSYVAESIPEEIEIHITTNRKFEGQYRAWQKGLGRKTTLFVEPVMDEAHKMGAVGSLEYWVKMNEVNDDLLVIASDNYFSLDMARFISHFDGQHTLVAVYDIGSMEGASQFGVVRLEGDRVIDLVEKPKNPKSTLIATACYLLPARMLSVLHDYCSLEKKDNLGDFIAHLIRCDEVRGYVFEGEWFDIGNMWLRLHPDKNI